MRQRRHTVFFRRRSTNSEPVLVMLVEDNADHYDHLVNSCLVKPVGYEEFSELMEGPGFYWLGWNTNLHMTSR